MFHFIVFVRSGFCVCIQIIGLADEQLLAGCASNERVRAQNIALIALGLYLNLHVRAEVPVSEAFALVCEAVLLGKSAFRARTGGEEDF